MYCRNCGEQINANQAICVKCGVSTKDGSSFCPNCGAATNPGAIACTNCGNSLKKTGDYGKYDKTTLAIICFFLGGLGIHNFMLGETKKGVVRIIATCCFGLGYILALIDFVKLLTDNYTVDPDAII